ncbi:MAG: RNA methyltransferase [Gemmatimonadetes bacterium]|nr:RNA methyltransferase [Gemmatimonadota bacterium]
MGFGKARIGQGGPHSDRFVVILNRTQDVVNIATAVRAMMNMGLRRLRLVAPADYNAWRIAGIAHGSESVLERAEFFDDLEDALGDCAYVVGTTARKRTQTFVWQHPREAAGELLAIAEARAARGPVAIVFGREDKGLSNEELDRCDRLLVIPTDPGYASLNLAQAVLLIGYELWLAASERAALPVPKRHAPPATRAQLDALYQDTHVALETIEFYKDRQPEALLRTMRAVYRRAGLTGREANLLRGIMIEVRKYIARLRGAP